MKSSETGGVKPMQIAGRMVNERERVIGMTCEERQWRKQWLQDQILSHNEPRYVPELQREFTNPIRRLYKAPLDLVAKMLEPTFGKGVYQYRLFAGRFIMLLGFTVGTVYYFKYNANDWSRLKGWRVLESRSRVVPGDPKYPVVSERSLPTHYNQRGFDKVTLNL